MTNAEDFAQRSDIRSSVTTLKVVAESETSNEFSGRRYGYSLYAGNEGRYYWRSRIRTYDGVRVSSSWSSNLVALVATDKDAATVEVESKVIRLIKTLNPDLAQSAELKDDVTTTQ